jgi:hypothetical protein
VPCQSSAAIELRKERALLIGSFTLFSFEFNPDIPFEFERIALKHAKATLKTRKFTTVPSVGKEELKASPD